MAVELIVHFVRSGEDETQDDCIRISKLGTNFLVNSILMLNETQGTAMRTSALMSNHGITRFLQDIFTLVALDCIPFESVQVTCPLAPAVSFDLANGSFEKARDVLVRLVDTSLTHWPEIVKEPCTRQLKRRRTS